VVAEATDDISVEAANWESEAVRWIPFGQVPSLKLHPGFALAWPVLRPHLGLQATLIVDGANVVGTRPDGWWKDRPRAAEKLRDQLVICAKTGLADVTLHDQRGQPASSKKNSSTPFLAGWWPQIELVVEGQAKSIGTVDQVAVVRASGPGDEAVVDRAVHHLAASQGPVVVVTADKALVARVKAKGATVISPGMLLRAL